ncbi:hypothetical protein F5Y16DRAFT_422658 [Xylariaceae sp. FL0255]|nr:hypothetical protein F5Y16DRAFT_422658 [Xylariaceae sp. FL0255]
MSFFQDLEKLSHQLIECVQVLASSAGNSKKLASQELTLHKIASSIAKKTKPDDAIITDMVENLGEINAMRLFLKWNAFHAIPLDSPISFSDLAQKLNAQTPNIRNSARERVLTHHAGLWRCGGPAGSATHLVAAGPPFCHRHIDSTGAPY